jgi:hypothetical protein
MGNLSLIASSDQSSLSAVKGLFLIIVSISVDIVGARKSIKKVIEWGVTVI